nr:hypothetical protein [Tanacetum cinerariifolium]
SSVVVGVGGRKCSFRALVRKKFIYNVLPLFSSWALPLVSSSCLLMAKTSSKVKSVVVPKVLK